MFAFACISFWLALCLYITTLVTGSPVYPAWATSPWVRLVVVLSHVEALRYTFEPFHPIPLRPRYTPLFYADRDRVRFAHWVLATTAATFLYSAAAYLLGASEGSAWRLAITGYLMIPAFLAVHWAFQPENVFPQWVLTWGYSSRFQVPASRPYAKRRPVPLHEWLTGVTACCEKAITGERLVNAESPGPGEIDCLQFQNEVLDELESRACLAHYKKLLSRDGFREIRRFVQAVDKLDHKLTNEITWPKVLQSARTVLSIKETLTAHR